MPYQVTVPSRPEGEQLIEDKLHEMDALDLARAVHANTGEVVTLTPWVQDEDGEYELDPDQARTFGAATDESADDEAPDFSKMTVKQIDAYAAEHGVEFDSGLKKDEKIAVLMGDVDG